MAEKKISPKAPEKSESGERAAVRVTKQSLRKVISHKKVTKRRVGRGG